MPTLGAALVALIAGWVLDGLLQPLLGTVATLVLSFVGSTLVFYMVRKWLLEMRGR